MPSGTPNFDGAVLVAHLPMRGASLADHSPIITLERYPSGSFHVGYPSGSDTGLACLDQNVVPYCLVTIHQGLRARGRAEPCMTLQVYIAARLKPDNTFRSCERDL